MKTDGSQQAALLYQIHGVNNAINTIFDTCISISQSRFEILAMINQETEISQSDLQKRVTIDRAAITRHVKQLEAHKMIKRKRMEMDNRIMIVCMTNHGVREFEKTAKKRERLAKELFTHISEDEYNTVKKVLTKLSHNVTMNKVNPIREQNS